MTRNEINLSPDLATGLHLPSHLVEERNTARMREELGDAFDPAYATSQGETSMSLEAALGKAMPPPSTAQRFMRIGKAGMAAGLILAASVVVSADDGASDEHPNPATDQGFSAFFQVNSPAYGLGNDVLFANDLRVGVEQRLGNLGNVTVSLDAKHEMNRDNSFSNGMDTSYLGLAFTSEDLKIEPSLRWMQRDGSDTNELEGAVFAAYQGFDALVVMTNRDFGVAKIGHQGRVFDAKIGTKFFSVSEGEHAEHLLVGAHSPEGTYGLWAGIGTDNEIGVTGTVDLPGIGVYLFGKHQTEGANFLYVASSIGGDERMGGQFSKGCGYGTTQVLTGLEVPPFVGPVTSFLGNGGSVSIEAAAFDNQLEGSDAVSYRQLQVGGKLGEITIPGLPAPLEFYAGAGLNDHDQLGVKAVGEGLIVAPTPIGNFNLEVRKAPEGVTGSLLYSIQK